MLTKEGADIAPIERVSQPMRETEDQPTQKMISRMNNILPQRFDLVISEPALKMDGNSVRFPTLSANPELGLKPINASLRLIGDVRLSGDKPLQLISGVCLFGSSGLTATSAQGEKVSLVDPDEVNALTGKVSQIEISNMIQPYEAEAILKMTQAINLVSMSQTQEQPVNLCLHVPFTEYKLYMVDLFDRGVITSDELQMLMDAIDQRSFNLIKQMEKRLNPEINLEIGNPLQDLETVLSQGVVDPNQIIQQAEQLPIVGDMITERGFRFSPMLEIPNFSYTAGYLLAGLTADQIGVDCLAIDPAEEEPIYRSAKKASKALGLEVSMGVLQIPPKAVTMNGRQDNPALFKHRTEDERVLDDLKVLLSILKQG